MTETGDLADAVRAGDRRALARAITLVESTRADHRADAVALLDAILPATGDATRVGISGAPGAGSRRSSRRSACTSSTPGIA